MSKGEIKQRYEAVAVGFNINPGDPDAGKAPQVEVECRVVAPEQFAGLTKYVYGSLHENAQEYTFKALRTAGWKCNDITVLEGLGSTKFALIEKEEEYKGKKKLQCSIWELRGPRATLREDDQAAFANRFKAAVLAVPVAQVGEHNAAPAVLPEKKEKAAATTAPAGDSTVMFD